LTSKGIRTETLERKELEQAFLLYLASEVPVKWEFDIKIYEAGDFLTRQRLEPSKPFKELFR
jgi:hypothetical protein